MINQSKLNFVDDLKRLRNSDVCRSLIGLIIDGEQMKSKHPKTIMNTLKSFIFSVFFLTLNSLSAQINDSNFLKDYKAPDYRFQSLIVDFSSSGAGYFSSGNNFRVKPDLTYNSYRNTQKIQGFNQLSLNSNYNFTKTELEKKTVFTIRLNHNSFNRLFLNDNHYYFGYGNYMSASSANSHLTDSLITKINTLSLNINPTVSFGKGRLEPVHYARKSMDIEKALIKSKSINGSLTKQQSVELADKIAKLQNRRFYDIRLNRMYQLESIDSIIQDMGLVSNVGMKYYTHLSDAFLYTHNPRRFSGGQFEIGVVDGFVIDHISNDGNVTNKSHSLFGFASYSYHLPKSYQIQHVFRAALLVGKNRKFYSLSHYDRAETSLNFEYQLGYYPTTRTFLDVTALLGVTTIDAYAGIRGNLYYYFSPKLRLQAQARLMMGQNANTLNIYYNNFPNTAGFGSDNYNFSLGINYSIF